MKEAASTGGLTFVLPQNLTGRIMNEVGPGAGHTHYGRVMVLLILRHVRQPMLHVHAGLGTPEYDRPNHSLGYRQTLK